MQKFKMVMVVLALTLAFAGSALAQDDGGDDFIDFDIITNVAEDDSEGGKGGKDIIDFDLINNAVDSDTEGEGGATYTVWRGSEPYDGGAASDMASEPSEDVAGSVAVPRLGFKF